MQPVLSWRPAAQAQPGWLSDAARPAGRGRLRQPCSARPHLAEHMASVALLHAAVDAPAAGYAGDPSSQPRTSSPGAGLGLKRCGRRCPLSRPSPSRMKRAIATPFRRPYRRLAGLGCPTFGALSRHPIHPALKRTVHTDRSASANYLVIALLVSVSLIIVLDRPASRPHCSRSPARSMPGASSWRRSAAAGRVQCRLGPSATHLLRRDHPHSVALVAALVVVLASGLLSPFGAESR